MRATDRLLLEIARCSVADACFESQSSASCGAVVMAQGTGRDAFHLPEPWSGDIGRAPILFCSWNPSWNRSERFPTRDWSDAEICEFFDRRFEHTDQNSQTWREIRGIAEHLLGRTPVAGTDYAITDIVHCKSWKGEGARKALSECSGRYLDRVLKSAAARVVVGLGRDAREQLAGHFGVAPGLGAYAVSRNGGPQRTLVLLGAPGSAQPRRLPPEDLARVRAVLA